MSDEAVFVVDGVTYVGAGDARTVAPLDEYSSAVLDLMGTGEPVGPGVDEWAGLTSTWGNYPAAMLGAAMDVAERENRVMTWYADDGTRPPRNR